MYIITKMFKLILLFNQLEQAGGLSVRPDELENQAEAILPSAALPQRTESVWRLHYPTAIGLQFPCRNSSQTGTRWWWSLRTFSAGRPRFTNNFAQFIARLILRAKFCSFFWNFEMKINCVSMVIKIHYS